MNSQHTSEIEVVTSPDRPERIDLLDLLMVVTRRKKQVALVTFAAAVVAAIVSLLLPKYYTAEVKILPPQQNRSLASAMLGEIGGLADLASSGGDLLRDPNDIYLAMLRSRTVADRLIRQFDLIRYYHQRDWTGARAALHGATRVSADKEGTISVKVDDGNPKRAADLANAYIDQLRDLTRSVAVTQAARRRLYLEEKLRSTRQELEAAEVALKQVQEKTGLIQPEAQSRVMLDAVADARAKVANKEIELQTMRSFATANNPDLIRGEAALNAARAQLAKLEGSSGNGGGIQLPTRKVPEVALQYNDKYRDVKYHETLFEMISKQYELAKVQEAQDSTLVQVLDPALVPERKAGPNRRLIVLVTAFLACLLSMMACFIKEGFDVIRQDPLRMAKLQAFRQTLWNGRLRFKYRSQL